MNVSADVGQGVGHMCLIATRRAGPRHRCQLTPAVTQHDNEDGSNRPAWTRLELPELLLDVTLDPKAGVPQLDRKSTLPTRSSVR